MQFSGRTWPKALQFFLCKICVLFHVVNSLLIFPVLVNCASCDCVYWIRVPCVLSSGNPAYLIRSPLRLYCVRKIGKPSSSWLPNTHIMNNVVHTYLYAIFSHTVLGAIFTSCTCRCHYRFWLRRFQNVIHCAVSKWDCVCVWTKEISRMGGTPTTVSSSTLVIENPFAKSNVFFLYRRYWYLKIFWSFHVCWMCVLHYSYVLILVEGSELEIRKLLLLLRRKGIPKKTSELNIAYHYKVSWSLK